MRDAQVKTIYLKDYSPPEFLIDETHLTFDLHEDFALVKSRLCMRANRSAEKKEDKNIANQYGGRSLLLHGIDLELLSLSIDGRVLDACEYQQHEESLQIFSVAEQFEFSCTTKIFPQNNTALEGLYKSRNMFCTQCEAEGFRKITFYLDRPDVLSVFTTSLEADAALYPVLLSNGEKQQHLVLENGRTRVTWHDPFKKPCYLFALVAGDLQCVQDSFITMSGRKIDLQIFVEQKDVDKCEHAMRSLKAAMRWDEKVYGREYDLSIFMIVAVDDFNMGAMENKGLNIFNTSCVLANPATTTDAAYQRVEAVVAHEYFHNWSGNRVTCRDWFQLSLKEGFTVYRDAEFSADMNSRGVKRIESVNFLRSFQFPEDAGPMVHPVRPASFMEISNFYTVTVYEKGAEVVRMLAHLLGKEKFRQATDLYFERFDGQAVTCDDFVDVMQEVAQIDLSQFKYWYSQAGTPELHVEGQYHAEQQRYVLQVRQSCPDTPETRAGEKQPFVIPLVIGLVAQQGDLATAYQGVTRNEHTLLVDQREQCFVFDHVESEATPSLLRGFSAPVKLKMHYSRDQLLLLWQRDSDPYARWDAGQQLALQLIMSAVEAVRNQQALAMDERLLDGAHYLLQHFDTDKALLAEMLTLPNEIYLAEQYQIVDVHAIHQAREFFVRQLATQLDWLTVYQQYQQQLSAQRYSADAEQIAQRRIKNLALHYLLQRDEEIGVALCKEQYLHATNMSDSAAALRGIVHSAHPAACTLAQDILDDFYQKWQHESLVVVLWLQTQAANPQMGALQRVQALMQHAAFDGNNPNKLRALISVFSGSNPTNFHQHDGAAYTFLADQIIQLDKSNPQIASRLLTPLSRWQSYPAPAAELMRQQLQRIASETHSKDVQERLIKSLK